MLKFKIKKNRSHKEVANEPWSYRERKDSYIKAEKTTQMQIEHKQYIINDPGFRFFHSLKTILKSRATNDK